MPGCARPVRILCSSPLNDSIDRAIFCSAVFLMSAMLMVPPDSRVRQSTPRGGLARLRAAGRSGSAAWLNNSSASLSDAHQRALVFALHHALQRARLEDAEHADRQLL